jgi:hypothetical protein
MKYLIVSGDSFTDENFTSVPHPEMDCSWAKWPELLGEKLGMEVINLAICGKGNEFIYSTLHDEILKTPDKSEIGLVIAAWSQCNRRDFQVYNHWYDNRVDSKGDVVYWANRSLRYYSAFEMLCKSHNIPYIHTQMIDMYLTYVDGNNYWNDGFNYSGDVLIDVPNILKAILEYDTILDTSKFIGWPITKQLGGNPLNRIVFGQNVGDKVPWVISPLDGHPNAAGQIKLAEYLYEQIK